MSLRRMREAITWTLIILFISYTNWHIDGSALCWTALRFISIIGRICDMKADVDEIITSEQHMNMHNTKSTKIDNCPEATTSATVNNNRLHSVIPSNMFYYFYHMEIDTWTTLSPKKSLSSLFVFIDIGLKNIFLVLNLVANNFLPFIVLILIWFSNHKLRAYETMLNHSLN